MYEMGECILTSSSPHFSLDDYATKVYDMQVKRGFSGEYPWLAYGCFKELGELCYVMEDAMAHNTEEENAVAVLSEFGDVMIYLLQLMNKYCPVFNLDRALTEKIKFNMEQIKKTYKDGKIIRR